MLTMLLPMSLFAAGENKGTISQEYRYAFSREGVKEWIESRSWYYLDRCASVKSLLLQYVGVYYTSVDYNQYASSYEIFN